MVCQWVQRGGFTSLTVAVRTELLHLRENGPCPARWGPTARKLASSGYAECLGGNPRLYRLTPAGQALAGLREPERVPRRQWLRSASSAPDPRRAAPADRARS